MNAINRPGSVDELTRLYRETILRHAAHPVGFRKGGDSKVTDTHAAELFNPLCGDRIVLFLEISGEDIRNAEYDGEACAICTASASLLCEQSPGQPVRSLRETLQWLEKAPQSGSDANRHEPLLPLLGVHRYPSRIKCATLPWEAAVEATEANAVRR